MATPATAPKPAPAPTQTVSTVRAQRLRDAQSKKLPIGRMKPIGYFSEPQQVLVPAGCDLEDILNPEFWAFVAPTMQANVQASVMNDRLGTLIHVMTEDHAFYAVLYVHGLGRNAQGQANAMHVTCIGPACDPATGKACPVDVKTGLPWAGRPRADSAAA